MNLHRLILTLLFSAVICLGSWAQSFGGYVMDDENNPVPFATILIPALETMTTCDGEGKYFINTQEIGDFDILVSSVGYIEKRLKISLKEEHVTLNIYLSFSDIELNEAIVKAKKRDPAYTYMKNAIDARKKYLKSLKSYKAHVYIKATEEKIIKEKPIKKKKKEVSVEAEEDEDVFSEDEKLEEEMNSISFLEMDLDFNYEYPNNFKEVRTAYQVYGDKSGFLLPLLSQTDFNFYQNLVELEGISEMPIISPIASTAILSYKFKLLNTIFEGSQKVYEIGISPRKKSNATVSGTIWINDGLWNIRRIEINLPSDALKQHDRVQLNQLYHVENDTTWVCSLQEFTYRSKAGKYKVFEGKTVHKFTDYHIDYDFPDKFFSNELGVTTAEAYERDSTYWENLRPEPLSPEEIKLKHKTDSITTFHKSPEYLDSLQKARNKITAGELLIQGMDFWNMEKKSRINVGSLVDLVGFSLIDGFRLGPWGGYFRKYDNEKYFNVRGGFNMGLKTGTFNGNIYANVLTNPMKRAFTSVSASRYFASINPYDAWLSQLNVNNYILSESFSVNHSRELVNGLFAGLNQAWRNREPIGEFATPIDVISEYSDEFETLDFQLHQAIISTFTLTYTPQQKYMTEPNRKIILGSRWPKFSVNYKKGWKDVLSSDVDFDFLELGMTQELSFKTLGYSKYRITAGKFLNTKDLFLMDEKRINASNPILFSDPMYSFQFLDSSMVTTDWFIQGHHLHHFNGSLINNIPFVKKLKIRAVAGVSALWVKKGNYRHEELVGGIERVFKIGIRNRLRFGVYGVVANSNYTGTQTGIKFGIDLINIWQQDWSF